MHALARDALTVAEKGYKEQQRARVQGDPKVLPMGWLQLTRCWSACTAVVGILRDGYLETRLVLCPVWMIAKHPVGS